MLGVVTLAYSAGVVAYWVEHGASLVAIGMSSLVLLLGLGFLDAVVTRVELKDEAMVLRTLKGARTIQRQRITSVGWEAGSSVSLKLSDGAWLKLPYLGNSQGCTNTIRAWLKTTADG